MLILFNYQRPAKVERKRAHLRYECMSRIMDDRFFNKDYRPHAHLIAGMRDALRVAYAPNEH